MKLGIMQPYFMPYIGYFSLIKNVDEFILFDTPQFIRHGWIERNRILKSNGEPLYFKGTVFTNGKTYNKGIISLILDQSRIEMKGVAVSGWKPVGTEKTITSCQDSWIKTIDDKPALQVLRKFLGDELMLDKTAGSESIIRLSTNFPIQVNRKSGYSVMRATLLANLEEQSIFCGGIVKEGDVFRFSLPPDFEVVDKVIESSEKMKTMEMPEADAMLVFTCVGRLESLGPMVNQELMGLANTWKKPMAGFFCLGEFGKAEGGDQAELHGTTCSWVALKEK
jgi:small ligand-binding sensory domain FIST